MIRIAEDVGVPVGVGVANLLADQYKPSWTDGMNIALSAAGYVGSYMGYGGAALKNAGIAATPLAVKAIVGMVKGAGVSRGLTVRRRVSRWPAEPYVKQFEGTRLD